MLAFLLFLACTGDTVESDDDTDAADTDVAPVACAEATETGTLAITIAMEADYIPSMDEEPIGPFYASVFDGADASGVGPAEGAVALADIAITSVDLTGGGPTAVVHTTGELPACRVAVVGCLDSDENDCDAGDPVTFPNDNFVTVAGPDTPFQVFLGLLNP